MKFTKLAEYLQKLEDTSSRLKITSILAQLINELSVDEVDKGLYLSLGYLKAEYNSEKFNIADKMMIKILSAAYEKKEDEIEAIYAKKGDLGSVAYEINKEKANSGLNINEAHEKLLIIAKTEGAGSQNKKINLAAKLLKNSDKLSAKYLVRIILGTTRLGFTELTVVAALSQFICGKNKADKKLKARIESHYRIHPDIGKIAKKLKRGGIKGLDDITIEVGVPIHAQKAQRLNGPNEAIEKMGKVWVEYKFDGTRVQLHMDRNKKMSVDSFEQQDLFNVQKNMTFIKTFTRNLEETTHQFPDLVEAAEKYVDANSAILDGEAIGYDRETGKFLPFQETIQRKRKHGVEETAEQIPLKYMVFDLLYLNGESLVDKPLIERRKILSKAIKDNETIIVDNSLETTDSKELGDYSFKALDEGFEGIMIKKINSPYKAGARNFTWVKLKKTEEQILNDTVDCVVLGYYHGRGDRAKFGIGGFLAGIWDEKDAKFKTITKVGSGLTDDGWKNLKEKADLVSIPKMSKNAEINKKYNCDVWTEPKIVVEIAADELSKSTDHSAGFALRFPRMIKYRADKNPKDTTSPEEIKQMHKNQNGK